MREQKEALTWNNIFTGSINQSIDVHDLRFVIDETKEDRIQIAIYPFSKGKVTLFTPTSEMPTISHIAIFNLADVMVKPLAVYDSGRDRLVIDMVHLEIFEETFVHDVVSFANNLISNLVVDNVTNIPRLEYHCKCSTPGGEYSEINYFDFWDGTKQILECQNKVCKETYHKECLTDQTLVASSGIAWQCPPCSLESLIDKGRHWSSGRISMTCTIDGLQSGKQCNQLQILHHYIPNLPYQKYCYILPQKD